MLPERSVVSASEVAAEAGLPLESVKAAVLAGRLRAHHPCAGWHLVERKDAERWVQRLRKDALSPAKP